MREGLRALSVWIAAVCPDGSEHVTRGTIEGQESDMRREARTDSDMDPIFYVPEYHCYSAELAPEERIKSVIIGKALEEMKTVLMKEDVKKGHSVTAKVCRLQKGMVINMKILIVSDTHHRNENYLKVLQKVGKGGYGDPPWRCRRQ